MNFYFGYQLSLPWHIFMKELKSNESYKDMCLEYNQTTPSIFSGDLEVDDFEFLEHILNSVQLLINEW